MPLKINLFSLVSLFLGVTCFLLAYLIFIYSKQKMHRIWAMFNFAVAVWGVGQFLVGIADSYDHALISWRLSVLGITFISIFFYHVVHILTQKTTNKTLLIVYLQGLFFSILIVFTNILIGPLKLLFGQFYYLQANLTYSLFFFIWLIIVSLAFKNLYFFMKLSTGLRKIQSSYLFYGMMLGFIGGATTAPPAWGINIYPAWHFFICIYAAISTYAIFRYQLMDIKVAVTRLSIFVAVYVFVLGIPVWVGFKLLGKGLWLLPITLMGLFATAGPFIFLYIQKRAEDALLAEQKRYQTTLRQASAGMGRIKDLKKLLNMIVYVLTRAVRLEHALVYIYDLKKKQYVLGASKQRIGNLKFNEYIEWNSSLVQHLTKNRLSLIHEEIKQKAQDFKDNELIDIEKVMVSLEAELIIPIFVDQNLTAIVAMGKKESGKLYNEDDLSVFTILANQAALAIENAQFYEDMKLTQEQLFQAEKMATIGTMADGLSHQINNRFHALGFIAGDALDTIKMTKEKGVPEDLKEIFNDLERSFNRVQDNVVQGGEVVQGLLRYTRKGDDGFTAVNFDDVFKSAYEMAQFKIKTSDLKVVRMFDSATIPKIKGNFTQLQEVFFNLIDNGYDAMIQRKTELKEPGFVPTLKIYVNTLENNQAEYVFEDNGAGVKPDDMTKLFTPFFTTKLSSKKGTGLGLYVIKKIIEENHRGQVIMDSVYMTGTKMKIRLPIAFE